LPGSKEGNGELYAARALQHARSRLDSPLQPTLPNLVDGRLFFVDIEGNRDRATRLKLIGSAG
jgi:hypothetical protein